MRIAIDAFHASQGYGGISRYVRTLVPVLAAASPHDSFTLFTNRLRQWSPSWDPGLLNVRCYDLRFPRRLMQACWDHLDWPPVEVFIGSLDMFHGMHFVLPAVRGARRVLTVHDLTYLKHPEYFADRRLNECGYRRELPRALARADAVIANSRQTRNDLIELMGYPEGRIRVIYPGVDERFWVSPDSAGWTEMKARYGLSRPYLVFLVGTAEPRKNLPRTVRAARRAAPGVPLVIIGERAAIRGLLGDDLAGVILPGVLPDKDLPVVLNGAELALYPSLYEGFGFPALEAMAAGVPLITSDRGALPEVVGSAAVLVDPQSEDAIADAIRRVLADVDLRERLVKRGQARVRELTRDVAAQEVLRLYRELV